MTRYPRSWPGVRYAGILQEVTGAIASPSGSAITLWCGDLGIRGSALVDDVEPVNAFARDLLTTLMEGAR